jgi:hypothetical protein
MNSIGEGIQEIKNCRFCQNNINANLEDWEIKAKQAQSEFKKSVYCEHKGAWERDLYDKDKNHAYTWNPKGHAEGTTGAYFCTNACCVTADNGTRPDLIIYIINAFGDEWEDPNHTFKKIEGRFRKKKKYIEDIVCLSPECKKSNKKTCKACVSVGGQCHECSQKSPKVVDKLAKVELTKSLNYFQENEVEAVTLKEGKLTVTYKNGKSAVIEDPEIEEVKAYLESIGKNTLSVSELNHVIQGSSGKTDKISSFSIFNPTIYWPWIIGTITILSILAGIYLYWRENNKESGE